MKKQFGKLTYDTNESSLVYKDAHGAFGDEDGYEETLYKRADGKYFFYVNGGPASPYPAENIKRVSAENAEKWLKTVEG